MAGKYDITAGNYVSYIQAQQRGSANLDIFAEGSVMEPGNQGIYTMPNSPIKTLAELKNQTIAINAPKNICTCWPRRCWPSTGYPSGR